MCVMLRLRDIVMGHKGHRRKTVDLLDNLICWNE